MKDALQNKTQKNETDFLEHIALKSMETPWAIQLHNLNNKLIQRNNFR